MSNLSKYQNSSSNCKFYISIGFISNTQLNGGVHFTFGYSNFEGENLLGIINRVLDIIAQRL